MSMLFTQCEYHVKFKSLAESNISTHWKLDAFSHCFVFVQYFYASNYMCFVHSGWSWEFANKFVISLQSRMERIYDICDICGFAMFCWTHWINDVIRHEFIVFNKTMRFWLSIACNELIMIQNVLKQFYSRNSKRNQFLSSEEVIWTLSKCNKTAYRIKTLHSRQERNIVWSIKLLLSAFNGLSADNWYQNRNWNFNQHFTSKHNKTSNQHKTWNEHR